MIIHHLLYALLGLIAVGSATFSALAQSFIAVTWEDDAVHFLDQNLADLDSFSTPVGLPNGVAASESLIWVGSFTSPEVIAYNYSGTEQFRWSLPSAFALQAMDYAGSGELLAMDQGNKALVRLDAFSGSVLGSVPAVSDSTEAIAIDGLNVWQLTDANIYLTRLSDGSVVHTIANAAHAEAFEGTAMASVGKTLVLGSESGNWFRVSKLDGSVLESGNNGLSMYDLQPFAAVPEPSASGLVFVLVSLALGILKFRNRLNHQFKTTL